jgi:ribosomal-protein-alanine N-acetyltransferase
MNYKIVPMTIDDIKQAAEIERLSISQPWSENAFLAELYNEQAVMLCAKNTDSGEVCGFIAASYVLDEVNINSIAVAEKYRKNGIGQALLYSLFEAVKDFAASVMLEVRQSNFPAIALYQKAGFAKVGMRKNFYENPSENAVLMTKFIGGSNLENTCN